MYLLTHTTMGYTAKKANPKFWIKNGNDQSKFITTYVDAFLIFSKDPMAKKNIIELPSDIYSVNSSRIVKVSNVSSLNALGDDPAGTTQCHKLRRMDGVLVNLPVL
jgi:hypothetical protein